MNVIKAVANIDAKRFLRICWVAQVAFLILVSSVLIFWFPDRMAAWMMVLPILFGAVAIEAAAATGGSSLKRLTEATVLKAKNGGEA